MINSFFHLLTDCFETFLGILHPILIKPYVSNTTQLPLIHTSFHGYAVGFRPLCYRLLPAGFAPTRQRFQYNYFTGTTHAHIQHAGSGCGTDDYRPAQRQVRATHPAAPVARALCCLYHCLSLRRRHTHLYRVPPYPGICGSRWTGHLPLHRYRPLFRQCIGPHFLTHGGHQRSSAGRCSGIRGHHARMDRLARHLRHTPGYRHHTHPHRLCPERDSPAGKSLQGGGCRPFRNSFPCCATENLPNTCSYKPLPWVFCSAT